MTYSINQSFKKKSPEKNRKSFSFTLTDSFPILTCVKCIVQTIKQIWASVQLRYHETFSAQFWPIRVRDDGLTNHRAGKLMTTNRLLWGALLTRLSTLWDLSQDCWQWDHCHHSPLDNQISPPAQEWFLWLKLVEVYLTVNCHPPNQTKTKPVKLEPIWRVF